MIPSKGDRFFNVVNLLLLTALALATLYPFLYVLTISLSKPADINRLGLHVLPLDPTWTAYRKVLANPNLYTAYLNTMVRTGLGVACVVALTSLTAYPLAKKSFPLRSLWMKLLVFSMMFSGGLIPSYLLIKQLGLINSVWALVLPTAVTAFNLIVMRNFFEAIPVELDESAKMDGGGDWTVFMRIVLPLSTPVLAVIALWAAVGHWNAWFDAMIYMNDLKKQVLQLFLRHYIINDPNNPTTANLSSEFALNDMAQVVPENLKAALIMIISFPILLAYPFTQKYFVKGIMLGSVKG
ncbi:carbohydrate ABC transporter permease [Paenibacillus aurantius]|uniref:Carbohydrate ABC transporter permease n=1 Tax=Paenibacillus aurantius TaxID=2918900 RepID=A0AA96RDA3_9BACL|nr:carbohydrate ABC transporter permease [Paenibacillus aurantius]WNQ08878.1 carbohydrate ABC transporter permease [Paenibacillus aurantius]